MSQADRKTMKALKIREVQSELTRSGKFFAIEKTDSGRKSRPSEANEKKTYQMKANSVGVKQYTQDVSNPRRSLRKNFSLIQEPETEVSQLRRLCREKTDQVLVLQHKYTKMHRRLSGEISLLNGGIYSMGDCSKLDNHMRHQTKHQRDVLSESKLNDEDKITDSKSSFAEASMLTLIHENTALKDSKEDMLGSSHDTTYNHDSRSLREKHGELLELFKDTVNENKRLITINEQQRNIIKNLTAQYEDLLFSKPCMEEIEEY